MTATSEAERIARYLHLVVELPKPTVDAGNPRIRTFREAAHAPRFVLGEHRHRVGGPAYAG